MSKELKEIKYKYHKAKCKSPWINEYLVKRIEKREKLAKLKKKRPYDLAYRTYFNNYVHTLNLDISQAKGK